MASLQPLAFAEKVSLGARMIYILFYLPFTFLRLLIFQHGSFSPVARKRSLAVAGARCAQILTLRQACQLMPSTADAIEKYAKSAKLQHAVVDADNTAQSNGSPTRLHFLVREGESCSRVLLYLHGGGYGYPIQPRSHLPFADHSAKRLDAKLVILEHGLAPDMLYPSQLQQAAAALNYLKRSHAASDIYIGGDSAGGHLVLGLLTHMIEAKPGVESVNFQQAEELGGLFCISPRTVTGATADSFRRNENKDIMSAKATIFFQENHGEPTDEIWASPQIAPSEFWMTAPVKRALIVGGADECYIDDIKTFAEKFGARQASDAARQLVVAHGEFHAQAIMDPDSGIEDGVMMTALNAWCAQAIAQ